MKLGIACVMFLVALPAWAQLDGWGRNEVIKYTPKWTGERLPDGRPMVPDALLERMRKAELTSEEAAWGPLRIIHGYEHQWHGNNWLILNPKKRLIGRAFTVQYMPGRPELQRMIESQARLKGLPQHNVRVMDMLRPGDVVVVDMASGRVQDGVFMGDNLAAAIYARTGTGVVINGSIRDRSGIEPLGFPVYTKGVWPGVFGDLMLTGINVPIRIGDATVMPGDVVVGDGEGLTFIPPHTAEDIVDNAEMYDVIDDWRKQKYLTSGGKIKPSDLYGRIGMRDPALQKECEVFARAELARRGLKPLEERKTWKTRGYSGSGCYPMPPPQEAGPGSAR